MEQLSQRLEEETAIIALVSAALGGFTGLPASVMSKAGMNCVGLYFVPKIVHIIITFWIIYKEEKQVKKRSKHHIASYRLPLLCHIKSSEIVMVPKKKLEIKTEVRSVIVSVLIKAGYPI